MHKKELGKKVIMMSEKETLTRDFKTMQRDREIPSHSNADQQWWFMISCSLTVAGISTTKTWNEEIPFEMWCQVKIWDENKHEIRNLKRLLLCNQFLTLQMMISVCLWGIFHNQKFLFELTHKIRILKLTRSTQHDVDFLRILNVIF